MDTNNLPVAFDADLFALGLEGFIAGPPPLKNITLLNSTKQCADRKLTPKDQGKFYDEATGELFDSLDVVIMKVNNTKSWQDKYDPKKTEQVIYCYSADGVRPTRIEREGENGEKIVKDYPAMRGAELKIAPEAVTCATCPHAQWHNKSVDCPDSYRMFVRMPDGTFRRLYAKGTSAKPARQYIQSFQGRRVPLAMYHTTVTAEFVSNTQNDTAYYVLKFAMGSPSTQGEVEEIKGWLVTFGKQYDAQHDDTHGDGGTPAHREDPTGSIDVDASSPDAEPELF